MASIASEINDIKNAIYGEDVRDAIVSALTKTFNLVNGDVAAASTIADGTSISSIVDNGVYGKSSSYTNADWPYSSGGGVLLVFTSRTNNTPSSFQSIIQLAVNTSSVMFRFGTTSGWSDWLLINNLVATSLTDADLNDVTTNGFYSIVSGASSGITNLPRSGLYGILIVNSYGGRIVQTFYSQTKSGVFIRYKLGTGTDSTFCDWETSGFFGDYLEGTSIDLDDLTSNGWFYLSKDANISHYPISEGKYSGYLFVMNRSGFTASPLGFQVFYPSGVAAVYHRVRLSAGWSEWQRVAANTATSGAQLYPRESAIINNAFGKMTKEYTTVAAGMPYIDNPARTSGEWPTYDSGEAHSGLPYSSVYANEGDILYNRTLSTFYSAVQNPKSVIYTQLGGVPHVRNDGTRACYYGVVCSTFGEYLFGDSLYRTSRDMKATFDEVPLENATDLEAGLLAISDAHTKLISSVYYDDLNEMHVEVLESVDDGLKKTSYNTEQAVIDEFLENSDSPYRLYRYPGKLRNVRSDAYATDVIFEYGNNTWYRINKGMRYEYVSTDLNVYVPGGQTTLYYKKASESSYRSATVSLNQDNVANIKSLLNETGTWMVSTNSNPTVPAVVTLVDVGTATISGDTITLSGYSNNLTPVCWRVYKKVSGLFSDYQPIDRNGQVITLDENVSNNVFHRGYIENDTFTVTHETYSGNLQGFLVRIVWDTGYGQCFSEIYSSDYVDNTNPS